MADEQMPAGVRLASVVVFVRDLDASVRFYHELLALDTADRSTTAALLVSPHGPQLVLRAMGPLAEHPLGGTGAQYLVWAAAAEKDLAKCERVLRERSAYTDTHRAQGITVVEGRDPDGMVVAVCYPGPDQLPPDQLKLWPRVYAW